ncbi:hypothetical protein Daus18300_011043 [Diaporthe australafricana]|uniref:Uncharacterized protein n=1 Tax=Diaporthe australafricana TaxID=127596 RepID=A0ABR3W846_9PEZI
MQDLLKAARDQRPEAIKGQGGGENESNDIRIQQLGSKPPRQECLTRIVGDHEEIESDSRVNEEFVEITHSPPPSRSRPLSREEIRSRAIINFLRGSMAKLFDGVIFHGFYHISIFVKLYDHNYSFKRQRIYNWGVRPPRFRYLPITKESLEFIAYVKRFYPEFNGDELYAVSGTLVEYKRIRLARRETGSLGYQELRYLRDARDSHPAEEDIDQ